MHILIYLFNPDLHKNIFINISNGLIYCIPYIPALVSNLHELHITYSMQYPMEMVQETLEIPMEEFCFDPYIAVSSSSSFFLSFFPLSLSVLLCSFSLSSLFSFLPTFHISYSNNFFSPLPLISPPVSSISIYITKINIIFL